KRGEYKPGARLPPERDLATMLKVSRPSVREALIALEVEGYVDVRVGSGVYVSHAGGSRGKSTRIPDSGPFELITARRLLESECAALAARNASPAQIRRMRAALAAMVRDRRRNVMPLENDRRFHLEMAEAAGNSALALLVRTLWDQRTGPLFLQLEHHFDTPDLWDAAIAEHHSVMCAIEAHDGVKARTTMRRHMDQAARRFQKSWTTGSPQRRNPTSAKRHGIGNGAA
ncbi:MAG TPA: FadR/GntR family transcriptional regulator, partial [Burkholderiaceae bacterium]|nr:FadR/GntR family transcriptional regulator [Burkholderiaceae bacterium]